MKQIIQNYKTGDLKLDDVPSPALKQGGVLVKNICSLISAGTEKAKLDLARKTLWGKAKERPDQVRQVLNNIKKEGWLHTYKKVMNKLDAPSPLGYSCAGVVLQASNGNWAPGERVACAGAEYAHHAEVVFVPENLCVKIPENVSFEQAAFTTLGAIAMQGVRQAQVALGENVVVIGLGLLGLLSVQILKAAGCSVLGVDTDAEKTELAVHSGADLGAVRGEDDIKRMTDSFSQGYGADAVIITAATSSSDPVKLAGEICRDRGRVVVVGAVKMEVPRKNYYEKELSLILSRSYGPGRYDKQYEEKGIDYPIGYVRWTEKRNMEGFLRLVSQGKIDLDKLITHRFKIEDAVQAYQMITEGKEKFIGILLEYDGRLPDTTKIFLRESQIPTCPRQVGTWSGKTNKKLDGAVKLGVIGAGSFAQSYLLPYLKKMPGVCLKGVATATGLTAKNVAQKFGFQYCTSDSGEILADPEIQAVVIATRHNLHVPLVIEALKRNKKVLVEKPLALTREELSEITKVWQENSGQVMVGFNRRFSPLVGKIKELFQKRTEPLAINYRINAGPIPKDHWVQDPQEGGGRIIGEVCHFVDLLQYLIGSEPARIYAEAISSDNGSFVTNDHVNISLKFKDGSIGAVSYLANGDPSFPKERIEIFGEGSVAIIDDFKQGIWIKDGKKRTFKTRGQDKGHRGEMAAFIGAVKNGGEMPVPFKDSVVATLGTFAILESLRTGLPVAVDLSAVLG